MRPHLLKFLTTLLKNHNKNYNSILNIKKSCGCILSYYDPYMLANHYDIPEISLMNDAIDYFKLCIDRTKSYIDYHKSYVYIEITEKIILSFNRYIDFIYALEEKNLTLDNKLEIKSSLKDSIFSNDIDDYLNLNNPESFIKKKEMLLYFKNKCKEEHTFFIKTRKINMNVKVLSMIILFYKLILKNINRALHLLEICKNGDF
jgi:hypothetical protein